MARKFLPSSLRCVFCVSGGGVGGCLVGGDEMEYGEVGSGVKITFIIPVS